jgi:CBS-domain-containing membrane protein
MNAADVMVSNVVSVAPDASVQDVAAILIQNHISAVPVVGPGGNVLGIVSEGDLIHRAEAGTEVSRSWWLDILTSDEMRAAEFAKSHAHKVADVMTRNVVTAGPETPLNEIAALLEKHGIKRLPIVKNGKLVGIVSRKNLLQALASMKTAQVPAAAPSDTDLRAKIMTQLDAQKWARPAFLNVLVKDGTVELYGMVTNQAEKKAVRVLAEATPGVRAVTDNLMIQRTMADD